MAKAKRHKREPKDRTVFYEAVPLFIAPPATIPDVRNSLLEGRAALIHTWRRLVKRLHTIRWTSLNPAQILPAGRERRARLVAFAHVVQTHSQLWSETARVHLAAAGLTTTNRLIQIGHSLNLAVAYAADLTARYAPPMAADIRRYLAGWLRRLSSRRARAMYLSLSLAGAIAVITLGTAIATTTLNSYANDISSPAALMAKKKTGTTILDAHGQVLFEGYGAQATKVIKLGDLPKTIKDATLAAEDPEFYAHPGFSWKGTARAAWVDLTHMGRIEGGSTLTQQLVKNALLTSDKKFERKYQELLLATQLEQRYSKDQILEMYLNEIYYGQGSSGIEAASQTYFHKPAHDLNLSEAALLAGLPLGPSRFDPNFDLDAATGRRDFVISRMLELGKITKTQAESAKATPVKLANADIGNQDGGHAPMTVYAKTVKIEAPHFVFYVLNQLRAKYGDDVVEQGGITVQTTLDLRKQHIAEQIVSDRIGALASHHVTNGGLISLEPGTGNILAMVGSTGYNTPGFGNVNVTLSELQPGSSFKPIAYATAFKKGWTGATIIDDSPLSVPNGDGTLYTPQNYDLKFHGHVTARHALDNSLNIPAVKTLQFAGIHDTIETARDMGITTLQDESRFGLALVLGGGEVRPIDMATVYGTFANGGTKVLPHAILKVSDRHGKDITKPDDTKPQPGALDPRIAYMITNILSDDSSRQPEFPANGPLHLSRPAAAKTGTTNDFRDNWTVGYTPQIVTAVWVGNNDHTAMENVDGITGAAPIWHDYMEAANADLPVQNFTVPAGVTIAKVCAGDGGLANPWDSGTDEVFLSGSLPQPCRSFPRPNPKPDDNNSANPSPSSSPDNPGPPDNPSDTPKPDKPPKPRFFPGQ
jgi:1A family penicillin-binding protein